MKTEIKKAVDGRTLISAQFRRASPGEKEPDIEVIFVAFWPEDFTRTSNPIGLVLLSSTRTDTREGVGLSNQDLQAITEVVALAADTYDRSLLS